MEGAGFICLLGLLCSLSFAAAGPLATDDLWWHLELGQLYAEFGPWLTEDPRLHTAIGPPAPNSWLFDVVLATIDRTLGHTGLRGFHAGIVLGIVGLALAALRRFEPNPLVVGLGTGIFVACASYRLLQLRPSLMTVAACLALFLLVTNRSPIGFRKGVVIITLCAAWANLHPGFLLGPVLLFAAAGMEAVFGMIQSRVGSPTTPVFRRSFTLALTALGGLLASGLNPSGFSAIRSYLTAGVEAVGGGVISDEWRGVDLFSLPLSNVTPTPIAWLFLWTLIPVSLYVGWKLIRGNGLLGPERGSPAREGGLRLDPTVLAFALAGLLAPLVAVRFLWMLIFPLVFIAPWIGQRAQSTSARIALPLGALLLLGGYIWFSAWSFLAPRASAASYSKPFVTDRYNTYSARFLADTGVEGKLFNPYFAGGFLEYWLSPALRTFVDGSLNFPAEAFEDYLFIQSRGTDHPSTRTPTEGDSTAEVGKERPDFLARLDHYGVDFFLGVGLPIEPRPGRPWRYTTSHLEREKDWLLVFRTLRSAVYLRKAERNKTNLDRIAAYYRRQGVPFDRERGIDVAAVLDQAPAWAITHGMAPIDFPELLRVAQGRDFVPTRSQQVARTRLASTWAALGAYREALTVDAASGPRNLLTAGDRARERRQIWSLIRLDQPSQALDRAKVLASIPSQDRLSQQIIATARDYALAELPSDRARIASLAIVFTSREGGRLKSVQQKASPRLRE